MASAAAASIYYPASPVKVMEPGTKHHADPATSSLEPRCLVTVPFTTERLASLFLCTYTSSRNREIQVNGATRRWEVIESNERSHDGTASIGEGAA